MDMIDPSSTLHIYNINKGHYHGRICFSVIRVLLFFPLPCNLKDLFGSCKIAHRRETLWEEYIFYIRFFFFGGGGFSGKIFFFFNLQTAVATYGEN